MSMREINTKQLTQVKPILRHGTKRFYFRYYCPDLQKDGLMKVANLGCSHRILSAHIAFEQRRTKAVAS